jgi:hypothetical protein
MAMIQGKMTSLDNKIIYATVVSSTKCSLYPKLKESKQEHHKVNVPVRTEHRNVRIPWDDEWDSKYDLKKSTKL